MGACPRTTYCHVGRRCERLRGTESRPEEDVHPAEIRDEGPKYQTVMMAVLEKEPTAMDRAQGITLKDVLIEEASYSMDFRNNYPYDRRMEELTAALYWLISRLDDHLPNRGDNSS
ncbi:hypothetical protein D917_03584 [Trichinella nativa]|uniref:Uncharacterized protein n=1 Tax=Trichinella nativa TaxID=6335 RepID=A0A1Y3EBE4_9BILA|nr:hypothetical protein D917_03584 [Trichinella nativa]